MRRYYVVIMITNQMKIKGDEGRSTNL